MQRTIIDYLIKAVYSIRMIYHIILAVPLMIASAKIDLAGNVFSITNINFLFIFLMSGLIFCSTLILWDKVVLYEKMTKTDKKLFPKSLLTWLFICYGLLCFWLFLIVFNKGDNLSDYASVYFGFITAAGICNCIMMVIRQRLRDNVQD